MAERRERKEKFVVKLKAALNEYKNVIIVGVDNVGSTQMQRTRVALRGKGIILMGKNTLIRKILRDLIEQEKRTKLEALLPTVVGNMGFVFTNSNLSEVRKIILENKVPAAAKSGSLAPVNVFVPPGPTGLDPGQTNFFQALNIATKIVKGAIEIISEVHLIKTGEKVTMSHVALLDKLNIRPFFYGFKVLQVYEDGVVYDASVLDMDQGMLLGKFLEGVRKLTAISLAIHIPNSASVSHIINGAFKNLVALALANDEIDFPQAKTFKEYIKNPGAFAAAAPAAAAAAPAGGKKEEPKKAAEKKKSSSEDMGGGFSMFD